MTSAEFVKNFGGRVLRFIENDTKEPLEQKCVRDELMKQFDKLFTSSNAKEIIEDAKDKSAKMLIDQLKVDIEAKQKRLSDAERLSKKAKKLFLNDGNDDVFSQVYGDSDLGNSSK